MVPHKNDPVLSGRTIWSLKHLELQNPYIISHFRPWDLYWNCTRELEKIQILEIDLGWCKNSGTGGAGEGGGVQSIRGWFLKNNLQGIQHTVLYDKV